jgi:hypothetical protein
MAKMIIEIDLDEKNFNKAVTVKKSGAGTKIDDMPPGQAHKEMKGRDMHHHDNFSIFKTSGSVCYWVKIGARYYRVCK